MYSINVFLTFSLSNLGDDAALRQHAQAAASGSARMFVHVLGVALCVTILVVTLIEKFTEGGWLTLGDHRALVACAS